MPVYRTREGISATADRIAALNGAAALILNGSTAGDEMERINIVSFLLEIGRELAQALGEANDPDWNCQEERA